MQCGLLPMQYLATFPNMNKRAPTSASNRERGKRMRAAREAAGLTQQQAATRLGIADKTTIWRWEKGDTSPEDVEAVAKLYRKAPAWLLFGVGDASDDAEPYDAWEAFEEWLETAPEAKLAKPWMLADMRAMRLSGGVVPTVEFYKRMLFALVEAREPGR